MRVVHFLLILFPATTGMVAQSQLTLSTTEVEFGYRESFADFLIPADLDTFVYTHLNFFLRGGDGGKAVYQGIFANENAEAGGGGRIDVTFRLGSSADALRPGGTLRFVTGQHGNGCSTTDDCGGGGGGGTAILYKDPGIDHPVGLSHPGLSLPASETTGWVILAVAGGGSGASVKEEANGVDAVGWTGESALIGTTGGNGGPNGENAGGTNGTGGANSNVANGGSGYLSAGLIHMPPDESRGEPGGSGFGAGGAGNDNRAASGGGGGFSGGGAGENNRTGGGGGSFASSSATDRSIDFRDQTSNPQHGLIRYSFTEDLTPGPPVACVSEITVNLDDGGPIALDAMQIDDGTTYPGSPTLDYLLCVSDDGVNFSNCREEISFDCDDLGDNRVVWLGVENPSGVNYCTSSTVIRVREGNTVAAPVCPADRTVNLTTGCNVTLGEEIYPLAYGSCDNPSVSVRAPNASLDVILFDFFTFGYTFISGTTRVSYANAAGSCHFTVTVNAGDAPTITCPEDRSFPLFNAGQCDFSVGSSLTELDYSGAGNVSWDITNGNVLEPGEKNGNGQIGSVDLERGLNTLRYLVTEPGDCFATCSFTIEVTGDVNGNPSVSCPSSATLNWAEEKAELDYIREIVTTYTAPCDIITAAEITTDFGIDCADVGIAQSGQLLSFTTGESTTGCMVDITLVDSDPPIMSCADRTFALNGNGRFSMGANAINSASTTSCGDPNLDLLVEGASNLAFDCNDLGDNLVTLTGTTRSGVSGSCQALVTIEDRRAPVATCRNRGLTLDESGQAVLTPSDLDNGSTDNCGIETRLTSRTAFDCDDLGDHTVTLFLTDPSGNGSSCTATVSVSDPNDFCVAFPVELRSFRARPDGSANRVSWSTAVEENVRYFEVQKSIDGRGNWKVLSRINAAGNSRHLRQYGERDEVPYHRTYYRLRSVDFDGTEVFSEIVSTENERAGSLHVYPNPVDDVLHVTFTGEAPPLRFEVLDLNGRTRAVWRSSDGFDRSPTEGTILVGGLPTGTYYLRWLGEGKLFVRRFVKR